MTAQHILLRCIIQQHDQHLKTASLWPVIFCIACTLLSIFHQRLPFPYMKLFIGNLFCSILSMFHSRFCGLYLRKSDSSIISRSKHFCNFSLLFLLCFLFFVIINSSPQHLPSGNKVSFLKIFRMRDEWKKKRVRRLKRKRRKMRERSK